MRITVPVGTRPEIVKLAGVVAALRHVGHEVRVVATGQDNDRRLTTDFFHDLGCEPDAAWSLPDGEAARQGGQLRAAYCELAEHRPDAVLVLGDSTAAPAVAMAARRFGVGVVHLEAGIRSFNPCSIEELNRRVLASLATVHLAPTELAAGFLRAEGVEPERIRVVGNSTVDALATSGVQRAALDQRAGVFLTAHRAANVDDPLRLAELVELVECLGVEAPQVVFPVHPRTRDRLMAARLLTRVGQAPGVRAVYPLRHVDAIRAVAASAVVVTDSGGLQEEASWLGVPVVVLGATTARWEGVVAGASELCGLDAGRVLERVRALSGPENLRRVAGLACPYGDGRTAERVVAAFGDDALLRLLTPREPVVGGPVPPMVAAGIPGHAAALERLAD